MAPRANWKGFLKIDEVICPVALYAGASISERISLHVLNRKTGNRVHRQFVDENTRQLVEADDQVKGYERGPGDYAVLEPAEIASSIPQSDKIMRVQAFIPVEQVDDVYFDRPYHLGPGSPAATEAYRLIFEGMRLREVTAIAHAVLFRRVRTILIRAHGSGLMAATLKFDYEVRPAAEVFKNISAVATDREMLDLAEHIIATKRGRFDPKTFEDRYDTSLRELVRAKLEGRPIPTRSPEPRPNVVDLMDALRRSAGNGSQDGTSSSDQIASTGKKIRRGAKSAKTRKPKTSRAGESSESVISRSRKAS